MKLSRKKNHLLALGILIVSFAISYLMLQGEGGLRGTGKFLALFTFVIVGCSFLMGGKLIPLLTSGGYFVSFLVAFFFQKDGMDPGGGRTNNMWGIWALTFFGIFVVSLFLESVYANKRLRN